MCSAGKLIVEAKLATAGQLAARLSLLEGSDSIHHNTSSGDRSQLGHSFCTSLTTKLFELEAIARPAVVRSLDFAMEIPTQTFEGLAEPLGSLGSNLGSTSSTYRNTLSCIWSKSGSSVKLVLLAESLVSEEGSWYSRSHRMYESCLQSSGHTWGTAELALAEISEQVVDSRFSRLEATESPWGSPCSTSDNTFCLSHCTQSHTWCKIYQLASRANWSQLKPEGSRQPPAHPSGSSCSNPHNRSCSCPCSPPYNSDI